MSVPVRTPWRRDLPGAALALAIWLVGSFILRYYLGATVSSTSAYGSLSAAIAVLFWLYVTALAVLIGAGLNAVVDRMWPIEDIEEARDELTVEAAARGCRGRRHRARAGPGAQVRAARGTQPRRAPDEPSPTPAWWTPAPEMPRSR